MKLEVSVTDRSVAEIYREMLQAGRRLEAPAAKRHNASIPTPHPFSFVRAPHSYAATLAGM